MKNTEYRIVTKLKYNRLTYLVQRKVFNLFWVNVDYHFRKDYAIENIQELKEEQARLVKYKEDSNKVVWTEDEK